MTKTAETEDNEVTGIDNFKRPSGGVKKRLGVAANAGLGGGRGRAYLSPNRLRNGPGLANGFHRRGSYSQQGQGRVETIFLPPSHIRFTQDDIKSYFTDGRSLEDTFNELASRKIKKRDIPMIDVVPHNGHWWTLNNRRLSVFRSLECKKLCKVIRVRVNHDTSLLPQWLHNCTTSNGGKSVKVRIRGDEVAKFPANKMRLFRRARGPEPPDTRKPQGWSRERYEEERREREERERAAKNPAPIGLPVGWGDQVPIVQADLAEDEIYDPSDLEFIDNLSGSSSNVSENYPIHSSAEEDVDIEELPDLETIEQGSTNVAKNFSSDRSLVSYDCEEIDFDNEHLYLEAVPELESIDRASPTPSEVITHDFQRKFTLEPSTNREIVCGNKVAPGLPHIHNKNQKKPLAYYFYHRSLKKRSEPMDPKPPGDAYHCGCGHQATDLSLLSQHKDKSGHWAWRGKQFDSVKFLIEVENIKLTI